QQVSTQVPAATSMSPTGNAVPAAGGDKQQVSTHFQAAPLLTSTGYGKNNDGVNRLPHDVAPPHKDALTRDEASPEIANVSPANEYGNSGETYENIGEQTTDEVLVAGMRDSMASNNAELDAPSTASTTSREHEISALANERSGLTVSQGSLSDAVGSAVISNDALNNSDQQFLADVYSSNGVAGYLASGSFGGAQDMTRLADISAQLKDAANATGDMRLVSISDDIDRSLSLAPPEASNENSGSSYVFNKDTRDGLSIDDLLNVANQTDGSESPLDVEAGMKETAIDGNSSMYDIYNDEPRRLT
ncbi:hypothetical protein, partial [Enterovibrio norvegicus]|uniref:hypothetical protein n=1 Tax=Enterovibrio norvegicus TaxID=188144 RepID=UPI00352F8C06